jgi:UDP-N-acetylmuramate: L-alanyl-gamma-D-glutamyl-meso-diaminopimelate ligase
VEVIPYAVDADPRYTDPRWIATPLADGDFVLTVDGRDLGLFQAPMPGNHNLRNTLAALIMAHRCAGVSLDDLRRALPGFGGIARRQQVIGTPNGITVYDDFAHHPTAVRETLAALRTRHPTGRLIAAFEPRSATACRRLHQDAYAQAFADADVAMIAPVGRDLPRDEILNTTKLADDLCAGGQDGRAARSIDELLSWIITEAKPGDAVALLSNGSFGSIHQRLIEALA